MAQNETQAANCLAESAAEVASQASAEIMEGVLPGVPAQEAKEAKEGTEEEEAAAAGGGGAAVPEVKFCFTAMSGEVLAELSAPVSASVREVKDMLVQRGVNKTARRMHFVPADGEGEEWMINSHRISNYLPSDHNFENTLNLLLIESKPLDANIALHSLGATIVGEEGTGAKKPLIQHDRVFPVDEFGDELLSFDATTSGEPAVGIPPNYELGSQLHAQFKRENPSWDGDCDVSWFLGNAGKLKVAFPGSGALIQSAGFTYCPWDRNYGAQCEIYGQSGDDLVKFGTVDIPMHRERGDPSRERVKSLFVAVPTEHHGTPFQSVVLDWGRHSGGRRLYFLYALGSLLE